MRACLCESPLPLWLCLCWSFSLPLCLSVCLHLCLWWYVVDKIETLRRPGVEPGSTAWKAAILNTIPPTLHVSNHFDLFGKYFISVLLLFVFPCLVRVSYLWTFMNCSQISLTVSKLSILGRVFNMTSKTSSTVTWLFSLSNVGYHSLRWMRVSKGTSTGVISSWDGTELNQPHCYLCGCSMYKNEVKATSKKRLIYLHYMIGTRVQLTTIGKSVRKPITYFRKLYLSCGIRENCSLCLWLA